MSVTESSRPRSSGTVTLIFIPEAKVSTVTNAYGFYAITLPKGEYTIIISYAGFENIEEHIFLTENIKKDFSMRSEERRVGKECRL